jgi:hypothetical protein
MRRNSFSPLRPTGRYAGDPKVAFGFWSPSADNRRPHLRTAEKIELVAEKEKGGKPIQWQPAQNFVTT